LNYLGLNIAILCFLLVVSGRVFAEHCAEDSFKVCVTAGSEFSGLPLDLLPPGARALGLGGAYTALADDSTAALTNPAGLTNLNAIEMSISARNVEADVLLLDPEAYDSALNYLAGDLNKTFRDSSTDGAFASLVVPFEHVTVSGFYSSQVNFKASQSQSDDIFDNFIRDSFEYEGIVYDYAYLDGYSNFNSVNVKLNNYGLSGAESQRNCSGIILLREQSDG